MRKVVSILIVFCVLAAVPVFEASGASIVISKLSKKTAGPFDVIKIYGAGLTAASDMRVIFANGAYVVTVPAIYGTKTTLEVGVPFFFDTKTGAIKAGVVKVTVKSKSLGIKSNTLTGFKITDLPRTTQAAGTVTLAFLEDLKTLTGFTQGQLDFLQKASEGKVDTKRARSGIAKMATNLAALQTTLADLQKGQTATQGFSITINKASLAVFDRIILGFLAQLDAVVKAPAKTGVTAALERDWVPPDGLAIPGLTEIYDKLASYAEEKGFNQKVLFEYLKRSGALVGTATGVLVVLGTLGVAPALGAAAGAVGLAYGIGVTGFVLVEYLCYYLGYPSGVDEAEGFWPLLGDVSRTLLQMVPFPLAKVCTMKRLLDVLDLALNERDVANALEEPVKKATPTIFQHFHFLTAEGSWAEKITITHKVEDYEDGPYTYPFSAVFHEKNCVSFSGQISVTLKGGTRELDVNGTLNGYLVHFTYYYKGTTYSEVWNFDGNISGDHEKMSGNHMYVFRVPNMESAYMYGPWSLSRK